MWEGRNEDCDKQWSSGADWFSDYISKSQNYKRTQVGGDFRGSLSPTLAEHRADSEVRAVCSGLCPAGFGIPPRIPPHPPQVTSSSASHPHCENSASFVQVLLQITSILVTQAPEVLSLRHGVSWIFLSLKLSPELLKQFLADLWSSWNSCSCSSWLPPLVDFNSFTLRLFYIIFYILKRGGCWGSVFS